MRLAEEADLRSQSEEIKIPEELKRREVRLSAIAQAKKEIQKRAQIRYEQAQAKYEEKKARREVYEAESGKKARGKKPVPPEPGPQAKDQVNLSDEASRIMPTSGGGFEQCYNAQAGVDVETHLIVEQHVSQTPQRQARNETCLGKNRLTA